MRQKYTESLEIIDKIAKLLSPDVIKIIEAHHGAERAASVEKAVNDALVFCRTSRHLEGALVHTGFAEIDGRRVEVSFPTPADATKVEKDSAFLANLAEKIELGYVQTASMSGL